MAYHKVSRLHPTWGKKIKTHKQRGKQLFMVIAMNAWLKWWLQQPGLPATRYSQGQDLDCGQSFPVLPVGKNQ